jgi:ribosomal protein S18 acetylase RimI-like enzyme
MLLIESDRLGMAHVVVPFGEHLHGLPMQLQRARPLPGCAPQLTGRASGYGSQGRSRTNVSTTIVILALPYARLGKPPSMFSGRNVAMLQFRPGLPDDRHRVEALWEDVGLGTTTIGEWATLVAGPTATVLVAEEEGELIGAGVGSFDGWRAYIYHVAVAEKHRHSGAGRALIHELERGLAKAGAQRVFVTVAEENTAGMALAASSGYQPIGEVAFVKEFVSRDL